MTKTGSAYFSPELFKFLRQLARNNNREWFAKNKARYEKVVRDPSLRFIREVGVKLKSVSPYLVADPKPFGGSLFRIYRDIRFSKDKSPYKTNVAMDFWHRKSGNRVHVPGIYLHLAPRKSFVGGGIWHPDPLTLNRIRRTIIKTPEAWKRVLDAKLELEGESLKRPPQGFESNHRFIEDLKRKDFIAGLRFKDKQVNSPRFVGDFLEASKSITPLNEFLAKAIGLQW